MAVYIEIQPDAPAQEAERGDYLKTWFNKQKVDKKWLCIDIKP